MDFFDWVSDLSQNGSNGDLFRITNTSGSTGGSGSTGRPGSTGGSGSTTTPTPKPPPKSALDKLLEQFTGKVAEGTAQNAWRRQLPTDNTQLLRQLSFNVGEMGMPGGYVGAVQMPSYQMPGPQLPAINNPDMSKYGRQPGYGEATFYQQSMDGGMAPIAAMSPMGVPENWKPGGNYKPPSSSLQTLVNSYLQNPTTASRTSKTTLQRQIEEYLKSLSGVTTTTRTRTRTGG